jgi:Putative MetA-pathway of phenol degradation
MLRTPFVTLLAALLLFPASPAAADTGTNPACKGVHSLWAPLPDACLDEIDTDRPHQTDTPHVVPAGHVQVESALAAWPIGGTLGAPPGDRRAHLALLDDNYKFGLVSRVDVQILVKHAELVPSTRTFLPPGPIEVRVKINLVEEKGWVPAITLVPWIFVPVAPSETLRGGPLVFWGWELPAHFELEMNAGIFYGAAPKPPAVPVVASALTHKIAGEVGVFVDVYATGPDVALGTGALWAFKRDMQIDLGTYVGLHGDEPVATPFVGFSVRR